MIDPRASTMPLCFRFLLQILMQFLMAADASIILFWSKVRIAGMKANMAPPRLW